MDNLNNASQKDLRRIVEQIERLAEEAKALAGDIRDKFTEAKGMGFDAKVLRKLIALRKKSKTDREEEEAILTTYMGALGMLEDTPLGQYARSRELEVAE